MHAQLLGTLQVDSGAHFQVSSSFVNDGNLVVNAGTLSGSLNISGTGSITKMSSGTYELDIGVDPAAHIFVNEGTFIDGSDAAFSKAIGGRLTM